MGNGRVAIAVMAKAPRAGRVKTRLCPPLSEEGAAAMGAAFLRDITENLATAARVAPIDPWIAYAPSGSESGFDGVLHPGTRLVLADGAGDMPDGVEGFGKCLLQATQRLLAMGYEAACVLNADSPTLPTACLVRLAAVLIAPGRQAVLGPADDGGYYALGVKTPEPRLFSDIAWSTERVAEQTRARADEIGLTLLELPPWYDVDDRAALYRLLNDLREPRSGSNLSPFAAPATAACVESLGLARLLAA